MKTILATAERSIRAGVIVYMLAFAAAAAAGPIGPGEEPPCFGNSTKVVPINEESFAVTCQGFNCDGSAQAATTASSKRVGFEVHRCNDGEWEYFCEITNSSAGYCEEEWKECPENCELDYALSSVAKEKWFPVPKNTCKPDSGISRNTIAELESLVGEFVAAAEEEQFLETIILGGGDSPSDNACGEVSEF